jgi:polyhydroxyalkanoate synthesis repressor PhaR|tara:strand:+ start:237 stop:692 length:456 start_codon:yes stop_codon:yes gene_type:complete
MKKIIIKKYPNRRLYNTQISSYVALNDLCQMVQGGVDFIVVDSKSKIDITRSILTQIIFEQESKGGNLLPISFMRQVISCYQDQQADMLPHYLAAMMNSFSANYKIINPAHLNKPLKLFEAFSKGSKEMFKNDFKIFKESFNLKNNEEDHE